MPLVVYVSVLVSLALALASVLRSALGVALYLLASLAHGLSMFALSSLMLSLNELLGLRFRALYSPITSNLFGLLLTGCAVLSYLPNVLLAAAPNYGVPLVFAYLSCLLLEPRAYATLAETVRTAVHVHCYSVLLLLVDLVVCAIGTRVDRREGAARAASARRRVRRAAKRVRPPRAAVRANVCSQRVRLSVLHA